MLIFKPMSKVQTQRTRKITYSTAKCLEKVVHTKETGVQIETGVLKIPTSVIFTPLILHLLILI